MFGFFYCLLLTSALIRNMWLKTALAGFFRKRLCDGALMQSTDVHGHCLPFGGPIAIPLGPIAIL